jgi:acyl-coenzyme A thioesterase PaaI-like protein
MTSPADAHVHDTLAPHSHERERERETLDGALFGDDQPCFGCSPQHPVGFRLRFERLEGEAVSTCFTPTADHQGPPGIMHGGLVTTLADELAAWVIIAVLGKFGFTVQIEAKFKKAIRVGEAVEGRAWLVRNGGRVVRVAVSLAQRGEEAFGGEFSFALLDRGGAERLLGEALPEHYARFTR